MLTMVKDKIDAQINTYPRTLWTLVRASRWAAFAGLVATFDAIYRFTHGRTVSAALIIGPFLVLYYGAVAWRSNSILKLKLRNEGEASK